MKKFTWLFLCLLSISHFVFSQTVPFPTGPRDLNAISPWGYTNAGTNWDTSPYLPFIYGQNMWFRLMPPNGVTYNKTSDNWTYSEPGKKYPLILFFQGVGELGSDNNKQLLHGGQISKNAVLSGEFPGFLLYPQSVFWTDAKTLIEKIIATHPIDINRIYVHGLSNGAVWTWDFATHFPTLVAAIAPMSGLTVESQDPKMLFTPIRLAQGGLDTNPGPGWTQTVVDWYNENGGQLEYFFFPTLGHGTWNSMYNRDDFFTWFLQQKKNKIEVLFNRTELCPDEPINVTMGFTPGFEDYEWRKGGVLLESETAHKITATSYGVYTGRILNRGVWSEWSEPVEVKIKTPTVTPPIQLTTLQSKVLPDINGNSSVSLTLPNGYETYNYYKDGGANTIGATQVITANGPGSYTGKVKEFGGCSSTLSVPFIVIDANGSQKPDPISNLQASTVSKTQLRLTWENNLTPIINETGFEIYRSLNSNGPYDLIAITSPNILIYNDNNLPSNTTYYYKIRPVGNNGAAVASATVSAITDVDITPPTAPNNLAVTSTTSNSVGLSWSASTDDVGVTTYDVFVRAQGQANYIKAYTTASTSQTVFQLSSSTLYSFIVKAKDQQENISVASQQVVAATAFTGLNYAFYLGNWSNLPNFSSLTPASTGIVSNFSLTPKTQNDQFGFVYTGVIQLPTTGSYTFFTSSDDGSRLYLNNTLLVDNDGLHGTQERNGTRTMNAGYYPIRVEFFEQGGGEVLEVRWQGPGISKQLIPSSRLKDNFTMPAAPTAPAGLARTVIDYRSIRINWNNYTGSGTDIEIYRSLTGSSSSWNIINTIPKTQNTYTDTTLLPSTRYYYRLRAVNPGNVSAFTSSVNATTSALPPLPTAPSNLQLLSIAVGSASIRWTDNSNNENGFEVHKSVNGAPYVKVATLPANTTQFTDNSLFAHTNYSFKVLSKNVRGTSAYSNVVSALSLNTTPQLNGVSDVILRFDDVRSIPLTAIDADNDFLVIGGVELPEFVQIFDDGSGNGVLTISPTAADLGEHAGLELFAMDAYGGKHTVEFNVIVNTNHSPVITPISPVIVKETNSVIINITAADADSDPITWDIQNAPAFMSSAINGNAVELNFQPDTNHAGTYNITLTATDSNGASDIKIVSLTVENYDPNFNVKVNFRTDPGFNGPSDWNNIGPAISTTPLNKENGTSSGIYLVNEKLWEGWKDASGITPGVYPNSVNGSYLWFWNGTGAHILRLQGLNPQGKYNLKFLASANPASDPTTRMTTFAADGKSQSIQANNNAYGLVNLNGLNATSQGELVISVTGPAGGYATLNAMIIESYYEGNEPPPAPSNLEVAEVSGVMRITWTDNAANELSSEIYRSEDNVNFNLLATLDKDVISYDDANFTAGVTYYYKVRALNTKGPSGYSNTGSYVAPNRLPVFQPVNPINIPELDMQWIMVTATDADNDDMTFTLENEPPFMWTEWVDNGKVNLVFAPSLGEHGSYQFLLHCDDERGGRTTALINVTITNINDIEYRVNFTTTASLAQNPWNNITSFTANTVLSNLKNNNNTASAISLTLQTNWSGTNPNGNNTGNNSGIYPDAVMSNSFFIQDNIQRNILLSGLDPAKTYDFAFYASRLGVGDVRNTIFAVGSKSVTLNASNNYSTLGKITGIKPAANGQVTININKEAAASYGYLNAMVIREYVEVFVPTVPAAPASLNSQVLTRTSIKLNWQDQSSDETGFEIWRSVGNNTNYTLFTSVGQGVTTYTNSGLSTNTPYYYKVRAINAVGPSLYSNETTGSTFDYSISVNFDAFNGNAAGWNNLSAFMFAGNSISNLTDELGANTGVSMTVVEEFAGDNPFGMVTGNNSGIVPDRVMEGSWWIDRTTQAKLRFGNLSFLKNYNFGFFASRAAPGDRNTVYIINGVSVTLNASENTNNMVQIKNIAPDLDGTITVTITTTANALFGYLNGLVIQAVPIGGGGASGRMAASQDLKAKVLDEEGNGISAYPNPFVDRIALNMGGRAVGDFKVNLVSATGVVIFEDHFTHNPDVEEVEITLGSELPAGVYLLRVLEASGASQNLRLIKK